MIRNSRYHFSISKLFNNVISNTNKRGVFFFQRGIIMKRALYILEVPYVNSNECAFKSKFY